MSLLTAASACCTHDTDINTVEGRQLHLIRYAPEYHEKFGPVMISLLSYIRTDPDQTVPLLFEGMLYYNQHDWFCEVVASHCRQFFSKRLGEILPDAPTFRYRYDSTIEYNRCEVDAIRHWYEGVKGRLRVDTENGHYVLQPQAGD